MKRPFSGGIIAVALIVLSGCASMAPNYTRPEAPVPPEWPSGPAYKDSAAKPGERSTAEITWKEFLVNGQLQKLIALALENNRDLRIAALNIERSQRYIGSSVPTSSQQSTPPAALLRPGPREYYPPLVMPLQHTSTASAWDSAPTNSIFSDA